MQKFALAAGLAACLAAIGLAQSDQANRVVDLLKQNKTVFGSMVPDRTEAGGAAMARDARLDFVFYDMERNYDLATLKTFMKGFRTGPQTLLVRIAPVADDRAAAQKRVAELLEAGIDGIVFPHIHNKEDAEFAVGLLKTARRGVWPLNGNGTVVGYFMIEDRDGVENARAIMSVPGVGIASPGQGSLRSAFNNDAQAAEGAIQAVIAACKSVRITCAKLVNDSDVEKRLQEGFRVVIASGNALDLGRKAAGR